MTAARTEIIGSATLHLGDWRDVLPRERPYQAGVMDPPYEFDGSGGGAFRSARASMREIHATGLDRGFDHQVLKPELFESVAVFCHNDQLCILLPWLAERYARHVVLAWHKSNPIPLANKHYRPDTEFWIHAWNPGAHPIGDLHQKRRWFVGPVGKSEFDHPTVKPHDLMLKVLQTVSGSEVVDPFMGTGSTGVAALALGRAFVGCEIEPKYFDIACRRIEAAVRWPGPSDLFSESA
jgi:site-specific DNA-methyltransferase (adenine-specific)